MSTPENTQDVVALDIRTIAARYRHPLVFSIFEHLPPGRSLVLTNDHDPRPLHRQFEIGSSGQFSWDYLAEGPELWQIRISKAADRPHCHAAYDSADY